MKYELEKENETVNAIVKLKFERTRADETKEPIVHSGRFSIPLLSGSETRSALVDALNNSSKSREV